MSSSDGSKPPPEWLRKRREQVAKASKKIRDRKKAEWDELRIENDALRKERVELLVTMESLTKELKNEASYPNVDPIIEIENRLLKAQVKQHRLFFRSIMESVDEQLPTQDTFNKDIAIQTSEYSVTEAARIMKNSQIGKGWSDGIFVGCPPLPAGSVMVVRHELRDDGITNIRLDVLVMQESRDEAPFKGSLNAKALRDLWLKVWTESELMMHVYSGGLASSSSSPSHRNSPDHSSSSSAAAATTEPGLKFHPLPEFSIQKTDWRCEAQHMIETHPSGRVSDWIFLNTIWDETVARSTLWCGSQVMDLLVSGFPFITKATHARKRARGDLEPTGLVQLYSANQTVTCHGNPISSAIQGERIMHHFTQSFNFWEDTISLTDDGLTHPCGRLVTIISLPKDFSLSMVASRDAVTTTGQVTQQFVDILVAGAAFLEAHSVVGGSGSSSST